MSCRTPTVPTGMTIRRFTRAGFLLFVLFALPQTGETQPARLYRVGAVFQRGPYAAGVDGLRDGLNELGLEEGTQHVLHLREGTGDTKSVEAAARSLEVEKVDLIVTLTTTVTLAAKRATKSVPIVFYTGADPVSTGPVESFPKRGGRFTGIHGQGTDLTAKRLELLNEMIPRIRRVVTLYRPDGVSAQQSVKIARATARQLKVERGSGVQGGLAAYGESYYALGRLTARYVQRTLTGASPGDLPIERADRFHLVINLQTAKVLGLTIPQALLARADEVIG